MCWSLILTNTAQKMKFSIKDFFSECEQIRRKLRIWSHLLKKSLMGNFIFCVVKVADLQTCNFIKKRIQQRCFSVKFAKSLRTPFFTEHLRRLLLIRVYFAWGEKTWVKIGLLHAVFGYLQALNCRDKWYHDK